MTYEDTLKQANESLTAIIRLGYERLTNDTYTDEHLEQQATKYVPTMMSLLRRINVKSQQLRAKRAAQIQQIYEREYEYYRTILSHNLEPHIRDKYLMMQQYATAQIYGLLNIIIAGTPPTMSV